MAAQVKSDVGAPSMADEVALPDEMESEWDAVSQASWESFPASDPPGWINASRRDHPAVNPTNRRVSHAGRDR